MLDMIMKLMNDYQYGTGQVLTADEIDISCHTKMFFKVVGSPDGEGFRSLHDSHVKNLSCRKHGNEFKIQMDFDAFVYSAGREVGKQRLTLKFKSPSKLHHLNHRELFDMIVQPDQKRIAFIYWPNSVYRLRSIMIQVTDLELIDGAFTPY